MCNHSLAGLEDLSSAEDFLEFFQVAYDPAVVRVNRLHILQRFHDYLERDQPLPEAPGPLWHRYRELLGLAYADFVHSDARTEKVFRVFQHTPRQVFVNLDSIGMPGGRET